MGIGSGLSAAGRTVARAAPRPLPVRAMPTPSPIGHAIAAAAHAIAPPARAPRVGQAVSTAARAVAPPQRLAARIASKGPAPSNLAAAIAAVQRAAAQYPLAPLAGSDLLLSRPLREMMFQGQFNQDFQTLKSQGLIPKNAKEPPLTFPLQGAGRSGELPFETGTADAGNALVHISPSVLYQATQSGGFVPGRAWAQETPIHELAHALQTARVKKSIPLREGGAQAFADAAAIRAVGPISENDTNYSQYVRNVRARKGSAFFMRNQFG